MTDPRPLPHRVRAAAIAVHRWVGLSLAVFLIIAGITGSFMVWYHELDAVLNADLYHSEAPAGAALMDPLALRERVLQQLPAATIDYVMLDLKPGRAVNFWIDDQETFVSPYDGSIQGRRVFGDPWGGRHTVLTFVYTLHFSLGLGHVGELLFGAVALLWTLDCFVGAYLTFPPPSARGGTFLRPAWWRRWGASWRVNVASTFAALFTWHRASGLWLWGVLLVFAWSAVGLNLAEEVYSPVMTAVVGPESHHHDHDESAAKRPAPRLSMAQALGTGRALMAAEARARGFEILDERYLSYDPHDGHYALTVHSTLDVGPRLAETTLTFDGDDGQRLEFHAPTGLDTRGTVDAWLIALHFGSVRQLGLVYRWFVFAVGLLVTVLSVTGVWIWWRKRSRRAAPSI